MLFSTTGVSAPALAAAPTATTFPSPADISKDSPFTKASSAINIPMNPPPTASTSPSSLPATMADTTPHPLFNFTTPSTPFSFQTPNTLSSSYSRKLSFWQQSTTSTPATSISSRPPSPADIKTIVPASTTTSDTFTKLNSSPTSTAYPFSSPSASTTTQFSLLPENEQRDIIQCADYLLALAEGHSRDIIQCADYLLALAAGNQAVPNEAAPKSQKRKAAAEPTERATKRTKSARGARSEQKEKGGNEPAAPAELPVQEKDYSLTAAGELLQEAGDAYPLDRLEVALQRCVMAELMREVRNDYRIKRLRREIRREKRAARWEAIKGRVRWNGEVYDL